MIVTVPTVRMVQVSRHQIVDVISVGYGLVTTAVAMNVTRVVGAASMGRSAGRGVRRVDRDGALVDMPIMGMMQVAIVQIVRVVSVLQGSVAAAIAVYMGVVAVGSVRHRDLLVGGFLQSPSSSLA